MARALADAVLAIPAWDVLLLTDMSPDGPFTTAVAAAAGAAGLKTSAGRTERISFMTLPDTSRRGCRRCTRPQVPREEHLKKLCAARAAPVLRLGRPRDDRSGWIASCFSTTSAGRHRRAARFQPAGVRRFRRALMKACLARDQLRLYALELSGQVVAMYYFLPVSRHRLFDAERVRSDFSDVKPGQVLWLHGRARDGDGRGIGFPPRRPPLQGRAGHG